MDQICLAVPILPGKTADARSFMRELDTMRRAEYDRSERRIGITKEVWYLAAMPSGDQLIAYVESADFPRAREQFSQSDDDFDVWFKQRMRDVTGVDLDNPADGGLPELLSTYEA
jgi:hypothetical protein